VIEHSHHTDMMAELRLRGRKHWFSCFSHPLFRAESMLPNRKGVLVWSLLSPEAQSIIFAELMQVTNFIFSLLCLAIHSEKHA